MPPGQFIIFHWWSSQQELHRTWSIQFYERLEEQQVSAFKIHPQGNGFLKKSYPQSLRFQIFKIPGAPNNQTIITTCKCAGSWQSHLRATISVELSPAQQLLSPPALGWTTGKLNLGFWEGDPHPKYPRQEVAHPTLTNWASNAKVSWNRNWSFFPFSKTSTSPRSSTCDSDATKRALVPLMNLSFWYVSISSVKVQLSS